MSISRSLGIHWQAELIMSSKQEQSQATDKGEKAPLQASATRFMTVTVLSSFPRDNEKKVYMQVPSISAETPTTSRGVRHSSLSLSPLSPSVETSIGQNQSSHDAFQATAFTPHLLGVVHESREGIGQPLSIIIPRNHTRTSRSMNRGSNHQARSLHLLNRVHIVFDHSPHHTLFKTMSDSHNHMQLGALDRKGSTSTQGIQQVKCLVLLRSNVRFGQCLLLHFLEQVLLAFSRPGL
mmetsp:Transcript_3396/g.7603  ORF Transcript_3396/g.7603 Transcript_3396/m.7603 type:complete len:237 (-) Transcript_3396:2126-2836(-)